ncbi:MAG: Txe/YoeB family addiction module toxin [Bacteroidota bacterium]
MTSKRDRNAVFAPHCREDIQLWVKTNRKTALRVLDLIEAVMRDPFNGIGKPEALKHLGPGIWSRRITKQDRLVYIVEEKQIIFLQARFHYKK